MLKRKAVEISKLDIEDLVANKVPESRTLDYKQELPGGEDDRRNFLVDVSAFANTLGGVLLYGIAEEREGGKNTGLPANCDGLQGVNVDAEKLRLESCIRDGIAPRIQGIKIESISGFTNGPILLIKIPQSRSAPHMVTFKNLARFFTRTSAGNSQMDVSELRAAFLGTEQLPERIKAFREKRILRILSEIHPIESTHEQRVVLHVVPLMTFGRDGYVDLNAILEGQNVFLPLVGGGYNPRFNLNGLLAVDERDGTSVGYAQLFRDGSIEATDSYILKSSSQDEKVIPSVTLERMIIDRLGQYRKVLDSLNVSGPLAVFLSLLNVRGFRMGHSNGPSSGRQTSIDQDHALFPEVLVDDEDTDIGKVLRPLFDMVWQSCGLPACWNYRDDGRWGRTP